MKIVELDPVPDPIAILRRFSDSKSPLLLQSALTREGVGRYSFLMADPLKTWVVPRVEWGFDPLAEAKEVFSRIQSPGIPELPPFQGGIAGFLGYEAGQAWEKYPRAPIDEFEVPDLAIGLYDWVIAWDHRVPAASGGREPPVTPDNAAAIQPAAAGATGSASVSSLSMEETEGSRPPLAKAGCSGRGPNAEALVEPVAPGIEPPNTAPDAQKRSGRAWLISRGWSPETWRVDPNRAEERAAWVLAKLSQTPSLQEPTPIGPRIVLNLQHSVERIPEGYSSHTRLDYDRAIERALEYIRAGDIFQVNLAQHLRFPQQAPALEIYESLTRKNPAPFSAFLDWGDWSIASASPERLVSLRSGAVETRPIKGTRRRSPNALTDLLTGDELQQNEKDLAENIMIVDLLRNDLSRVCQPGSFRITQLCGIELYETVQHLVSVIKAQLKPGRTGIDLLQAIFPGGSITGAPKVRAMEIIAELERSVRGPYCGSIFYLSSSGDLDCNILIRTFTISKGWIQCPVGGGIVADSQSEPEFEETLIKAAGMLRAIRDR